MDDPRFFPEKNADEDEAIIPTPMKQLDAAIEERDPIKHLLKFELDGNHPRKLWRFGNITAKLCDELNKRLLKENHKATPIEYGT